MVGSIAYELGTALWGGAGGIDEVAHAPFWSSVLQIMFVNVLLSGDNAVIIAMACRGLPGSQRRWGLVVGAGAAVVLRIVFTAGMVPLLQQPYLRMLGGVALLYIGAKLLLPEDADEHDVEAAGRLWRAVRVVVAADIVMSFDNILAVVEIANGDLILLALALAVSIPLVIAGAALIGAILDRFPLLIWAGAGLLGWIAGETIASDPVLLDPLTRIFGERTAGTIALAASAAGVVVVLAGGAAWRRWRIAHSGRTSKRES